MRRRQTSLTASRWLILVLVLGGAAGAVRRSATARSHPQPQPGLGRHRWTFRRRRNATLTLAYSPEKAALVRSLVDKFNARNLRTADREAMRVELVEMTPEEMVTQALAGPSFQALTPDSSLWLDQLNRRWSQSQQISRPGQIPARLVGDPVRYAITPIVIAAWEDTARQLGWPDKPVGWTSLQARARQDANFKWSHPSTAHASGLLATLAEFYAGAGVQRGLTDEMAQDPKTIEFVSAIEKTVRYYGEGRTGGGPAGGEGRQCLPGCLRRVRAAGGGLQRGHVRQGRRPGWWRSTPPRARCGPTTRWPCSRRRN